MVLQSASLLEMMGDINYNFDWGSVTAPVNPERQTELNYFNPTLMTSISSFSNNAEQAWEVIYYLNSTAFAEVLELRHPFVLVTNYPILDERKESFYKGTPVAYGEKWRTNPSADWYTQFIWLLNDILKSIVEEELSIEQGIFELQNQGQDLLNEWHALE